ncbi:tryptophan--tRNA ligase [Pseudokineococcus sp. 5B2Z-1]|uniref:tryptophan--tRNA ligase n=1 Tax=Pseudokineococcus sp. 5B2Z-1 TaxID=3132744 RepID=UPI0030A684B3
MTDTTLPTGDLPDDHDESYRVAAARSATLEQRISDAPSTFRVLTGDRPTGTLHLGHYFGTLANRVRLQRTGMDVLLVIADYQVITDRDSVGDLRGNVLGIVADYLAAGIDPARATIFTHSAVPALNQLMLPFLSLVTDAELRRNPTIKAEADAAAGRALSGLLLTYPVHQAADILFARANLVPVGRDQLPHLEATRTIARRFNDRYAGGQEVFPVPDALLTQAPLLLGTDGVKMSKSRGNAIELRASADDTARLLKRAKTDTDRTITYDPVARPEVANLLLIAALCTGQDPQHLAATIGTGGAAQLKATVTEAVNEHLRPLRRRRAELTSDPGLLLHVLHEGNARAKALADATLDSVRTLMAMTY